MSAEYAGQDPLEIAKQAERDLKSNAMKSGEGRNQRYDNSSSSKSFLQFDRMQVLMSVQLLSLALMSPL